MADEPSLSEDFVDFASALGATASSSQCFSVYVPNKDSKGKEIGDQRKWVLEAILLLTEINGGATAMPPVEGGWRGDNNEIVWKNPVVVYSFIRADAFKQTIPKIREFLHRMGRETGQGEIAFEFESQFFLIRTFDPI